MVELNLNHCPNCGKKLVDVTFMADVVKGCTQCDVLLDEIQYCGEPFTVSQIKEDDSYRWTLYGNRKDG